MSTPQKAKNISEIPAVAGEFFENIFNIYQTEDDEKYYYFNIGKKIVFDVENIDENYIEYFYIDAPLPLTTISYRIFGTQHLWWLIASMNNLNPLDVPAAGTTIISPRKQYLSQIMQLINR